MTAAGNEGPYESKLLHPQLRQGLLWLGLASVWDFERTVAETTLWYRDTLAGKTGPSKTKEQITSYMGGEYHDRRGEGNPP
jgi:hypothetical protein